MFVAIALLLALSAAIAAYWWYAGRETLRPPSPPTPSAGAPSTVPALPPRPLQPDAGVRHPIEQAQTDAPPKDGAPALPSLAESDAALRGALAGVLPGGALERFFLSEEIVRRIVVTVDNAGRAQIPHRLSPVKPIPGRFLTGSGEGPVPIGPENYARYTPFVRMVEAVDPRKLAAIYARFYPLFQEQYVALGYPGGYFNDRLVQVIDLVLATPEPASGVEVVQRKVLYEYADPALEALAAGQKTLLRVGPENATRLRAWLREFRRAVAGRDKAATRG
jgi:hypothetical protein